MTIDEELIEEELLEEPELKKTTFGTGLLKGLGITLRHLLSRTVTIQYPDEKDILPPRSRGVIALKTENCTVCMLCAKECPDWCIYIEGRKESREPTAPGKRAKKFNVLDRFAIDYALCMYCGICVEVCPYDALFWSPEYEYAEYDITKLTHEMPRLNDWMYYVLPPAPLDEGAQGPQLKAAVAAPAPAPPGQAAAPPPPPAAPVAAASEPVAATATAPTQTPAAAGPTQAAEVEPTAAGEAVTPRDAEGTPTTPEAEAAVTPEGAEAIETEVATGESAPQEPAPAQPAPGDAKTEEEAAEIRQQVYEAEMAKGSDPRVAEGRAKAAEMRAIKGTKGP